MRPYTRTRGIAAAVTAVAALSLVAACGSDDAADDESAAPAASADASAPASDEATGESAATGESGAAAGGVSLAGVCPDTVAVQTDWNPESEHGALYAMVGEGYEVDADAKTVTGPLTAGGVDTGVKIQVRAGGPAIAFQSTIAILYQDDSVMLSYANTDEAIAASADQPTLAVVAPLDKNPQMIMWDPETYPDAKTIADIGKTDAKVLFFQGATYMEYLTGTGVLKKEQVDGSYDGTPANFVGSGGAIAQQGFASAEPYIYENEVAEWAKPVAFQLIHDTGYPIYSQPLAIRADRLEELTPCLELLVPIVQQATIDYVNDPAAANAIILDLVEQYDTGWVYSQGVADFSVEAQLDNGLVGNGADDTLGNFEEDRVQTVIDIAAPILTASGANVKEGLTPADLVTNDFIDPSIGLG